MDDALKKKIRAAIAGVVYYIRSEEDQRVSEPLVQATYPAPWAQNGRQTIMQMRSFVQRRLLRR